MDFFSILTTSLTSAIGPVAAIYALALVGLNMHFGYTGLLNFGHVGFMLVGAYGVAISVGTFGLPLSVGVVVAILCAVVLALLIGIPTLRLRADYLAICTIAVAEALRFIYRAPFARDFTGGVFGRQNLSDDFRDLNPFPPGRYGVGDITFSSPHLWTLVVTWSLVLIASLIMWSLMHSPWGRVIKGIREDQDAVRSLGKNVFTYKLQSLVVGGIFGALAGVMIALHQASITPDQFRPQVTFYLWAMLLLGGAGRTLGPIIGSVVMWFLLTFTDETMRALDQMGWLPFITGGEIGAIRHALVGLILVLLIIYRPQGIIGDRREMLVNVK